MKKLIKNAAISLDNEIVSVNIIIENGKITGVSREKITDGINDTEIIDADNNLLIPGMIDVHIHGANNHDMMDGTEESIQVVSEECAKTGCTSFLVTSVSSSIEDLLKMIECVQKTVGEERGALIAGIHLEGPYLNPEKKGMQNEKYLRHPDIKEMELILSKAGSLVKMITIAPELPGGFELVEYLRKKGIIVSIAHSGATYEEAKHAFELGAEHITHCFNAMPQIHHRDPGLIVAAFEEEKVSLQAIIDGIHLHPAIVRLMYNIKGADKMVLITDALQAMNAGDGEYMFGGHHVKVENGVARLADGTLASSTVTMNKALKLSVEMGVTLHDAIKMASKTPAEILGISGKGQIKNGYDADLVLLDKDFNVVWTMINGNIMDFSRK
ncbi:N-acetylglucosamine-6-phosphate deacetylase [Sebaldella sp. S0638]|uniref:N-acetylglucosamine-6-phosphate deacetylase n=1 Tax=Sebaldella sp. S0638 TaxID=2957809 RepID=UPI00209D7015|nr:N-acetylglucosamine-6-phosphate deacetylase [Sebaldella sp. S0638]MCP1224813.1 N-acetylglucosamine-6-phosphate deacetylase [Sebaldella sp. S0638]